MSKSLSGSVESDLVEERSILDGAPVDNRAFPILGQCQSKLPKAGIVGHCPACGAPIYGPKEVTVGGPVQAIYSCDCQLRRQLGMQTK